MRRDLMAYRGLVLAGAVAAALTATMAPAASADVAVPVKCRSAKSVITGATAVANICWGGTYASLSGTIYDTLGDSRKANFLVHYRKLVAGKWRQYTASAGDTGGLKAPANRPASWNGEPVKDVWIKACRQNTLSQQCDSTWR
jgi:hypothetical protein